jgi:hypothetical protein
MTISKQWILSAAAIVLFLLSLGGYELLQEHDARLKAESTQAAQARVIKVSQDAIDKARADQLQTANDLKTQIAAITAQRAIIVTPQQATAIANTLPNLPQQVVVQQVPAKPATPTEPAQVATQQIVIPQADIPAFQKYKLDCDESNAELTACNLNLHTAGIIQQGTAAQLKAMTVERDTWEVTAKGGTFWHRLKHDVVVIGVTAAVAYGAGRLQK